MFSEVLLPSTKAKHRVSRKTRSTDRDARRKAQLLFRIDSMKFMALVFASVQKAHQQSRMKDEVRNGRKMT